MTNVAVIGAAYSANKGAASMMQSLLDNLPEKVSDVRITAVSTHPTDDKRAYAEASLDVPVVSQTPKDILLQVPLAMIAGLLRKLGIGYRWLLRTPALRTLHEADIVADLSGISFVDGRRVPVIIYNALVTWVPMLLGTPVVKCSQAMGPFKTFLNRRLAKFTLKRLARVCPRGAVTESHVRGLGLPNVTPAGDLAFAMRVPDSIRTSARELLAAKGGGPYLTVSPSQVVATYCEGEKIQYPQIMAEFIDKVGRATGHRVVMIAHSAQAGKGRGHMNDLPLCREIAELVTDSDNLIFLDDELMPTTLRAIIAESDAVVTSRFHAMISALTERVPSLVIGWSHKYGEVLDPFGLAESALTYDELANADTVVERTEELLADSAKIIARIDENLPAAQAAAQINFEVLAEEINRGSR